MVGIAIAMFIALFGWGAQIFRLERSGRKGPARAGHRFILGIIGGFKAKS